MPYFKYFPYVQYEFPDEVVRSFKNISLRPDLVKELKSPQNLEEYLVTDNETPELIAYKFYNDVSLNWIIMLANDVLNLYEDWPKSSQHLEDYIYDKYRVQKDSEGIERTLTNEQVYEFVSFVGSPTNGFKGAIDLDSENGPKVVITPRHFIDSDNLEYGYSTWSITTDAYGRTIKKPQLTPVSHYDYEQDLNDEKKRIYVPSASLAVKIKKEMRDILNG